VALTQGSQEEIMSSMTSHAPRVDKLQIEVTNSCNFNCVMCPRSRQRRRQRHMDFAVYTRAVDEIAGEDLARRIGLHVLGEPMLYPRLFDAIEYAKSRGLAVELTTNGSLLDGDALRRLAELKLDRLAISLVTCSAAEHLHRRAPLGFERYRARVLGAVSRLHALRPATRIEIGLISSWSRRYFTVDDQFALNEDRRRYRERLAGLVARLRGACGREVDPTRICKRLRRLDVHRDTILELGEGIEVFLRTFADWGNALTDRRIHPSRFGYCSAAIRTTSVLSNGDVTPCAADHEGRGCLGNLKTSSLADMLRGPAAQEMLSGFARYRVVRPQCQRCLGGPSRLAALIKGLLSIWIFKIRDPVQVRRVSMFDASACP